VQTLRGELASLELQRGDAEGQLQQLQQVRPGGPLTLGVPCVALGIGWVTHFNFTPNLDPATYEEPWLI
jgi:hypothetical protein